MYCSSSTLNSDKEQVHDIETIFQKHIEENFKHIKASHGDEE